MLSIYWSSRRLVLLGTLLSIVGCASAPPAATGTAIRSPSGLSAAPLPGPIEMVVIDAGHGGHDPGTSHFGFNEKSLALDIARRLKQRLQAEGLQPVMTRETDQFIPLPGRPGIANRLGADLFVSVHINANRDSGVSGTEVYYPRESVVAASAQWPPAVTESEVGIPSLAVKQVLWDLVLTRSRGQSRRLASTICREMRRGLQVPCHGAKAARFVVLREAWMPSVLVEVGYVTNYAEAQRLAQADYRQAIAESIAAGITSYIRELGLQHI